MGQESRYFHEPVLIDSAANSLGNKSWHRQDLLFLTVISHRFFARMYTYIELQAIQHATNLL